MRLILAMALWPGLAAWAGSDRVGGPPPEAEEVLADIHQTILFEIELGKLARERAASERVRRYGDRLARDHAFADQKVLELARQKDIVLPPMTRPDHMQKTAATLRELSGEAFDQAYLHAMHQGHESAIRKLEAAREELIDNDVRRLVGRLLPILGQHERLAQNLHEAGFAPGG